MESVWDEVLERSRFPSSFRSWCWAQTWLNLHLGQRSLRILTFWVDSRLVGIAPFYLSEMRLLHTLSYRCLRMVGDTESGGEYLLPFFHREFEPAGMLALGDYLQSNKHDWDLMWLPNQASWSSDWSAFQEMLNSASVGYVTRPAEFSVVELGDSAESFWKQQSRSNRTMVKRAQKRLDGHQVTFDCCRTEQDLERYQTELFRLHHLRWQSGGEQGAFIRRPGFKAFVTAVMPLMLEKGWLRLHALSIDGVICAIQFGFVYRGVYSILQEGFDPDSIKGIGHVLRSMVIEACIAEGLHEYDFLGGFSEHKRRWGATCRNGEDVLVWHRQLKSAPFDLRPLWPTGRFLQEVS